MSSSVKVSCGRPRVPTTASPAAGTLAVTRGPAAVLPALLYVAAAGIALLLIDLDHHRLPDAIVLPSYPAVAGLLALAGLGTGDFPVARTALSAGVWLGVYALIW